MTLFEPTLRRRRPERFYQLLDELVDELSQDKLFGKCYWDSRSPLSETCEKYRIFRGNRTFHKESQVFFVIDNITDFSGSIDCEIYTTDAYDVVKNTIDRYDQWNYNIINRIKPKIIENERKRTLPQSYRI